MENYSQIVLQNSVEIFFQILKAIQTNYIWRYFYIVDIIRSFKSGNRSSSPSSEKFLKKGIVNPLVLPQFFKTATDFSLEKGVGVLQ